MSDLNGLEQQLSDAKGIIARKNMALKLAENFEFRTLIMDGFCRDEVVRLTGQSADPSLDERQRADALSMAQAGGHLKRYLSMMIQMAVVAERDVSDIEQTLDEMRAEGAE